jgi:hypothetical protein
MANNGQHNKYPLPNFEEFLDSPAGKQLVPIVEDISDFVLELGKEADRSAVIVGATKIDVTLEKLLKLVLFPSAGGRDDLFDNESPLSTFSAKISIAYRLGLIDHDLEHAIQLIRKIRNNFAHTLEQAKLSLAPNRDRVTQLSTHFRDDMLWKEMVDVLSDRGDNKYLAEFAASLGVIIRQLELGVLLNKRVTVNRQCGVTFYNKK